MLEQWIKENANMKDRGSVAVINDEDVYKRQLIYAWKGNWMPKKYQNINQTV